MPGPRSSLPSLDDAIAFAKGVARALNQMTGDPYGEPALSELRAGEEKSEEGFGNPLAFAHTVIDWYVQATGDFYMEQARCPGKATIWLSPRRLWLGRHASTRA
jgi:hypothetical protein